MKKVSFILCLGFQTLSLFSQAQNEFVSLTFKNEKGDSLLYRMIEPLEKKPKQKYPLVIFLHGSGERGHDNKKQLMHGSSLFLKEENQTKFPSYVIFPQCPENDNWSSVDIDRSKQPLTLDFDYSRPITQPLKTLRALIAEMVNSGTVDSKRIYILGLSMGGMGAFEAVYRFPKLFAAAVPICGGGDTKLFSKKAVKVPFWIFHGDADRAVEVENSRDMVAALERLHSNVKYTEYLGVGHNSWDNAFQEPDLLMWLFSKKK